MTDFSKDPIYMELFTRNRKQTEQKQKNGEKEEKTKKPLLAYLLL